MPGRRRGGDDGGRSEWVGGVATELVDAWGSDLYFNGEQVMSQSEGVCVVEGAEWQAASFGLGTSCVSAPPEPLMRDEEQEEEFEDDDEFDWEDDDDIEDDDDYDDDEIEYDEDDDEMSLDDEEEGY